MVEANGTADFPVLFARAILEYEGMTKDVQNIASKSTYKEQLETKDEPVAWMNDSTPSGIFARHIEGAKNFGCTIPLYTTPQRTWVGLKDEEIAEVEDEYIVDYRIPAGSAWNFAKDIEAKLKERNT